MDLWSLVRILTEFFQSPDGLALTELIQLVAGRHSLESQYLDLLHDSVGSFLLCVRRLAADAQHTLVRLEDLLEIVVVLDDDLGWLFIGLADPGIKDPLQDVLCVVDYPDSLIVTPWLFGLSIKMLDELSHERVFCLDQDDCPGPEDGGVACIGLWSLLITLFCALNKIILIGLERRRHVGNTTHPVR